MGVKIDKNFNKVLNIDPISDVEKMVGKHHDEFDTEEQTITLFHAMSVNHSKNEYLKGLGDTHFSMKWDEFINIITGYGFIKGLEYDIHHEWEYADGLKKYEDKAVLYYHPEKGLIIWATSYWNTESVNGGKLYGEISYPHKIEKKVIEGKYNSYEDIILTDELNKAWKALSSINCSHGAFIEVENGLDFSIDVREGLINKLYRLEEHFVFNKKWNSRHFLWFLDFVEERNNSDKYTEINLEKISRCPKDLQDIVEVYVKKYPERN